MKLCVLFLGQCQCNPGFGDIDCSIDITMPPTISGVVRGQLCDVRESEDGEGCKRMVLFGENFQSNDSLACHYFNGVSQGDLFWFPLFVYFYFILIQSIAVYKKLKHFKIFELWYSVLVWLTGISKSIMNQMYAKKMNLILKENCVFSACKASNLHQLWVIGMSNGISPDSQHHRQLWWRATE